MTTEVETSINININTSDAAANLRVLQRQINAFQTSLNSSNAVQAAAAKDYAAQLAATVNQSKYFTAETMRMRTAAAQLDDTLSRGRGNMAQFLGARFAKNGAAASQVMQLARARAAALETQFVATGAAANGFQQTLAIRPMQAFNKESVVTAERLAVQRAMLTQATTSMISFGKNTQWAGRQLMVGFTVPLTLFGAVAGKTFMDLQKQIVAFKKVYGDAFTTNDQIDKALDGVQKLAKEYTRYGIAVKDTLDLAAQAAAAGSQGQALIDATTQSTRLAVLGQMEQNDALSTTISLQNAFKISSKDLGKTIDFLNQVENQTVVTLQDLSAAIPRVAPVIKGLGGNVQDLAAFMAAMQEGGVSAAQGANALKSGLASLINPTDKAVKALGEMGININTIINANRGDLMGTVKAFAEALSTLDNFGQQQALEKVFGKWQYARLGALFKNIIKDGTQASRVMDIASLSTEKLAQSSEKELRRVADNPATQFTAAMERLKLSIAPIGEVFVKVGTVVFNIISKIADAFNNLPDGVKSFTALAAIIIGVVVPAGTMFLGLILNLTGTLVKFGHLIGVTFKGLLTGGPKKAFEALTQSVRYMSLAEIDTANASKQLEGATEATTQAILNQTTATRDANDAILDLGASYVTLATRMREASAANAGVFGVAGDAMDRAERAPITVRRIRRGFGGSIPGSGNTDTVPAMLTPGEFVVNKNATKHNLPLLQAINQHGKRFSTGGAVSLEAMRARAVQRGLLQDETQSAALARTKAAISDSGVKSIYDILFPGGVLNPNAKVQRRHAYWMQLPPETLKAMRAESLGALVATLPTTMNQKFRANGLDGAGVIAQIKQSGLTADQIYAPILMQLQGYSQSTGKRLSLDPKRALKNLLDQIAPGTLYKDANFESLFRKSLSESIHGAPGDVRGFIRAAADPHTFKIKGNPGMSIAEWANTIPVPQGWKLDVELARSKSNPTGKHSKTRIYLQHSDGNRIDITPNSELGSINSNDGIVDYTKLRGRLGAIAGTQYTHVNTGGLIGNMGQVQRLGGGGLFLGQIHSNKYIDALRRNLEYSDSYARRGKFGSLPVTSLGKKRSAIGGHSSDLPGINGIYDAGVFKGSTNPESSLMEARSAYVMREIFGLKSPMQSVTKVAHPATGQEIIGLLSPFDPVFANPTGKFDPTDIADQMIAGAVRRDRDGQPDNIYGRVVADNGPSIFGTDGSYLGTPRATEPRHFGFTNRTALQQLDINMLRTPNGGAKKFFAQASADAARMMTEQEYVAAMQNSIKSARQRLRNNGLDNLPMANLDEISMYRRRIESDLNSLEFVDWAQMYRHHTGLKYTPPVATPSDAVRAAKRRSNRLRTEGHNIMPYGVPGFAGGGLVTQRLAKIMKDFELVNVGGVNILRNKKGTGKTVAQVIGKFQPFTAGHQGLVLDTLEEAQRRGADFVLGTSLAHGTRSNNGLNPDDKFNFIRSALPGIEPTALTGRLPDHYKNLSSLGYNELLTSVGADRAGNASLRSMTEKAGMKFSEMVTSRNDGISGTQARAYAINGDFAGFMSILPPNVSATEARKIYNTYRTYAAAKGYAVGGPVLKAAMKAWSTSSARVRKEPEYLNAINSLVGKSRLPKDIRASRQTVVGLSAGSEFDSEMSKFLLKATPEELSAITSLTMNGPFSVSSGQYTGTNDIVERIKFLKEQHARQRAIYKDDLKMIDFYKAKIAGTQSPELKALWQSRLDDRLSNVSHYRARATAMGKEIKALAPHGYRELTIFLDLPKGTPGFHMPNYDYMGKYRLNESEHVLGSGKYDVSIKDAQYRANGGPIVPGTGNKDTVPAMLTPGEFVINKKATEANIGLLHAINNGSIQGFAFGGLAALGRLGSSMTRMSNSFGNRMRGPGGMSFSMGAGTVGGTMMMSPMFMGESPLSGIMSTAGAGLSVLSMAPMLSALGPALLPVVALGGIAAATGMALKAWRNSIDNNAKEAAKFGSNLGGTANALRNMSELISVDTPADIRNRARAGFTPADQQVVNDQFTQIFESDAGKKFIEDLKGVTSADRFRKLTDYITSAVAAGMMNQTTGQAFAKSVGLLVGDAALGAGVAQRVREQGTGVNFMMEKADKRANAVFGSEAATEVSTQATVAYEKASQVIGGAVQVMQDYANVQAMSEDAYRKGTETFNDYIKTVSRAKDMQEQANKAISDSLNKSSDRGGAEQALASQLALMGISEDDQNRIKDSILGASVPEPNRPNDAFLHVQSKLLASYGQNEDAAAALKQENAQIAQYNGAMTTSNSQQALKNSGVDSRLLLAVASGQMSPAEAAQLGTYLMSNSTGYAATYATQPNADMGMVMTLANANENTPDGLTTERYVKGLQSYFGAGGNAADFDSVIQGMSSQIRNAFVQSLSAITTSSQAKIDMINDNMSLSEKIGADAAGTLQTSQVYKSSVTAHKSKDIVGAVSKASGAGVNDTIIRYIIDTEGASSPEAFIKKTEEITKQVKALNGLPDEIIKGLKIDISDPQSVAKFGPIASSLQKNWGIIQNLNSNVDMVASMEFLVNGGKASPAEVSANVVMLNTAFKNLSSGKSEVRKKAQIDIAIAYAGKNKGVNSPEAAAEAMETIHKQFKNFDKLDPIAQAQIIQVMVDVEVEGAKVAAKILELQGQLKQAVATGDYLGGSVIAQALGKYEKKQASMAARRAAALAQARSIASGAGDNNTPKGGGDKQKSIIQELKKSLKDTQAIYDAMQSVLSKNSNGFKNFIAGPFAPEFIEYLKSQGDRGLKILKEHGAKFQEAYRLFSAQQQQEALNIKQSLPSGLQRSAQVSMGKTRATLQLRGQGVGGNEADSIVGQYDEGVIAEYNAQSMRANRLSRKRYKRDFFDLNRKQQTRVLKSGDFTEQQRQMLYLFKLTGSGAKAAENLTYETNAAQLKLQKTTLETNRAFQAMGIKPEIAGKLADMGISADMSKKKVMQLASQLNAISRQEWLAQDPNVKLQDLADSQISVIDLRRQIAELNKIDPLQKEIDAIQEQNDLLDRQIELKNREIETIDDEIDKYNDQIDDLNKSYDIQVKALDQIEAANDRIYKIQSSQLTIANALSSGDVAAAAAAMQSLQQDLASDRSQSTRNALELAHNNAVKQIQDKIDSLTEHRKSIENEIKAIQLQQRANSDVIYARQLSINAITKQLNVQYDTTNLKLQSMNAQLAIAEARWKQISEYAKGATGTAGVITNADGTFSNTGTAQSTSNSGQVWNYYKQTWQPADQPITPYAYGGRVYGFAAGGSVPGIGITDKIPAMLTPGEYVVRANAAKNVYPLLDAINSGYSNMAGFAQVTPGSTENQYNISVSVGGSNASPEDIANAVMSKIASVNDQNIRSYNR